MKKPEDTPTIQPSPPSHSEEWKPCMRAPFVHVSASGKIRVVREVQPRQDGRFDIMVDGRIVRGTRRAFHRAAWPERYSHMADDVVPELMVRFPRARRMFEGIARARRARECRGWPLNLDLPCKPWVG
jgi:hypothetical protein